MTINAIIADDHAIIQEGLKGLLKKKGVNVVACVKNGREAIASAVEYQPDIVIMDISMPGFNGVEATGVIREKVPEAKIIALSMHSSKKMVGQMFTSGAVGYVLKGSNLNDVSDAIDEVLNEKHYMSPPIARMYRSGRTGKSGETVIPRFRDLSAKERDVLRLVAEGEKTRDIAKILGVSEKTIESHRRNIMKKLGISSIAGLTKFAIKEGIIILE